jgi:hypothetical protein
MSTLNSLKLVAAKRPSQMPPFVQRRNRLIAKIWEQMQLANALEADSTFSPTSSRIVKDGTTGERRRVEFSRRVKPWWWTAENGKVCLNVRYGAKNLEIMKGKPTIEVGNFADVVRTLDALKAAVSAGELDAQIDAISSTMRSGFVKK